MKFWYSPFLFLLLCGACETSLEKKKEYTASIQKEDLQPQDLLKESIDRGNLIYADFCVTCHMPDGKGVDGSFPPLADSDYLINNRKESIRGVKYGHKGEILVNGVTYNGVMAPMGLEDDEVADVMNYIMNSWGNSETQMVTPEEVALIEK